MIIPPPIKTFEATVARILNFRRLAFEKYES